MTGMESLFNTLLKSMGFKPEVLREQMEGFFSGVQSTLRNFETQFDRVETKLDRVTDILEIAFPQVPRPASAIDPELNAVIVPLNATVEKEAA